MKIHELAPKKGSKKEKVRVGRGIGSGLGKTSGRGAKGQKSRSGDKKMPLTFEGGQTPLYMRVPKVGFRPPFRKEWSVVNLSKLVKYFKDGDTVDKESLYQKSLIKKNTLVKILGNGDINIKLHVKVDAISNSAKEKIEKAGGTVEVIK